uniref:Gamma-glutamyltransferase 1b n=1 Tax=Sphaeramia orbicularis TaxID=375764 RepID=A0A673B412_9TELE
VNMVKKTVIVALMMLVVAAVATFVGVFFGVGKRKPPNEYFKAAVAADAGLCSEVGRDILIKGGSAVDAAIAAMLCTGLVNAHSMGIGGGLFLTIYNATTGKVETIDARETAPRNATQDMFGNSTDLSLTGGLAIAVPGEIRGYEMAHRRHGKLPWKDLFQPSIDLAEKGFPLGRALHIWLLKHQSLIITILFCGEDGDVRKENETIMFPKLAETYRKIATEGPNAFYEGQLAQNLVADIAAAGTMFIDLELTENKVLTYHRIVEAFRFAYAKRTLLGDPKFLIQNMTSDVYADALREKITDDTTHDTNYYEPQFILPENHGTTHISVVAEDGSAVAATSTINHYDSMVLLCRFGGAIYSSRTGIILNNELSDFCGRADAVKAGEQPPSSMTPVILESKSGRILVIGGSGGSLITTAVALSIMNHLWLGMNLTEAISAPIVFVDSKNNVHFEPLFDKTVIDGLKAVGHKITHWKYFFNVVNAVEKEGGCISAFSDIRKMGQSAGY